MKNCWFGRAGQRCFISAPQKLQAPQDTQCAMGEDIERGLISNVQTARSGNERISNMLC